MSDNSAAMPDDNSSSASPTPYGPPDVTSAPPTVASVTPPMDLSSLPAQPAQSPQQAAPQRPSLWRAVLSGALSGLAAGSQVNTRGMSGAGAFAAGAGAGVNQVLNVQPQQQAQQQSQQQQAQSKALLEQAQAANYHINTLKTMQALSQSSEDFQNKYLDETSKEDGQLIASGALKTVSGPQDHDSAMQTMMAFNKANPALLVRLSPTRDEDGQLKYQVVTASNAPLQKDVTVTDHNGDPQTIKADGITTAKDVELWNAQEHATASKEDLAQSAQADKSQLALRLQSEKDSAAASRAAAKNSAAWVPGATADEKKKAELAENLVFNANNVAAILNRRPDIVGKIAGRITSYQKAIGTDDPDIVALAQDIHNIGMANGGLHGMRSPQQAESYADTVLNNFKNGRAGIYGGLKSSVGSVQTFIDNARPETYPTHSKQGGAAKVMVPGGQQ